MRIVNLPFLTESRLDRMLKELNSRGRFILASRAVLEAARKRYANKSLKQKVEYLEADLKRVHEQLDKLQHIGKLNTLALKQQLSRGVGEKEAGLLGHLEAMLRVIEDFGGMGKITSALEELERKRVAGPPKPRADDDQLFSPAAVAKLKEQIIQAQDDQLQALLSRLGQDMEAMKQDMEAKLATKVDVESLLTMTTTKKPVESSPSPDKMSMLMMKMMALEERFDDFKEDPELRKEKNAIRELQKKVAGIPVDQVRHRL